MKCGLYGVRRRKNNEESKFAKRSEHSQFNCIIVKKDSNSGEKWENIAHPDTTVNFVIHVKLPLQMFKKGI